MLLSSDKRFKAKDKDTEKIKPKEDDKDYFREMRGKDGRIPVDIEKARKAMEYAMKRHAEDRRRERLENVEEG